MRFADVVENHVGEDAPILVLPKDQNEGPTTAEAFITAMLESGYEFNAKVRA
jgi:hypothetical protein